MIRMITVLKLIPAVAAVWLLAACSTGGNEPSSSVIPATQDTNGTSAAVDNPAAEEEEAAAAERPQTENFDLRMGEQAAALHPGKDFSLYVFEGFDFNASTGRLNLTANADYYVDIKRLPQGEDLKQLRESAEKELKTFGKVSDYSGELVEHPLGHAELYLQASGAEGVRDYIVWKSKTGEQYLFRLSNPKGEESSAFSEKLWVSLSTVQGE
ncbi:hypothetical protein [Paenibacillus glycanilyticus]|uniref:hypothetical protein n=1 Tax=Paenibacillus glycanilyticus TaxID=126569 RepID=UPI00190FFBAB|nr:hypothetical protein [Paenibacillus glycanilyticus]